MAAREDASYVPPLWRASALVMHDERLVPQHRCPSRSALSVDAPHARRHDRVAAYRPPSDGRWLTMLASSRDPASVGELLAIAESVAIGTPPDTGK
jgi:hypothetical protein